MLERIVIGTANFSREYNGHCVDEKEQDLIMEYMKEVGIEWLDVAIAYGTENVGKGEFRRIFKGEYTGSYVPTDLPLAHSPAKYTRKIHDGCSVDIQDNIPCNQVKWLEIPYSIMNQEWNWWHTKLIARSIFCKGKALKYFSPQECIDFVLMNPRIDKVILGVDSVDQLKENVAHLVKMEKFEHDEEVDTRKF